MNKTKDLTNSKSLHGLWRTVVIRNRNAQRYKLCVLESRYCYTNIYSVSFLSLYEHISIKKELQFVLLCTTPHCSPVSVGLDQQDQSPGAPCYPELRIWAEHLEGLTCHLDTVNCSLHNEVHRQVLRSS